LGILNPLSCGQGVQNQDFSAAYCNAVNHWQIVEWTSKESRLKASLMVPYEDPLASVKEIDLWGGDNNFAQILLLSRTAEPLGQRKYWPIFEAACRANLPVAVHAFGYGGAPVTGGGWPSFYIEEMVGHAENTQSLLTSMVFEGVFERFPTLKLILVEAGFAWLPALSWRLDKLWNRMRVEIPHVTRPPSELIRQHVWLTTQPMEEPEPREHLLDTIEWIGWEKLLFATDYPHWDFDEPSRALPIRIGKEQKEAFFLKNALELYNLN
jgi:predicted TIM-barrel fold metal-dependent hydrolase